MSSESVAIELQKALGEYLAEHDPDFMSNEIAKYFEEREWASPDNEYDMKYAKEEAGQKALAKYGDKIGPAFYQRVASGEFYEPGPAIGYYFKAETGINPDGPYDNDLPAAVGETGGAWCQMDAKQDIAEMDILAQNPSEFAKVSAIADPKERALAQLHAITRTYRFTPIGAKDTASYHEGEVQGQCRDDWSKDTGTLIPFLGTPEYFQGPENFVQTYAVYRDYKDGDELVRKADAIIVWGPNFGGSFRWDLSNGIVTNSDVLIEIYETLGYEYVQF